MEQLPVIFGIQGLELNDNEVAFLSEIKPYGIILFRRNCASFSQVKRLTESIYEKIGENTAILIDEEGGAVTRLKDIPEVYKGMHFSRLGSLAIKDIEVAKQVTYLNHIALGSDLCDLGITINCSPVLDLYHESASSVIGTRSFSMDTEIVTALGRSAIDGLNNSGIYPVIKHIPGHGRATVDSHKTLPTVDAPLSELEKTDFIPFVSLSDVRHAMTAHIIYEDIDPNAPITLSQKGIQYIRDIIGFRGLIITDDIDMKALSGGYEHIVPSVFKAGCDILLQCDGDLDKMQKVVKLMPKSRIKYEKPAPVERHICRSEAVEMLKEIFLLVP